MLDDRVFTLGDFDRQTARLELAARLRGDGNAELVELIGARETERQRIISTL